MDTSMDTSAAYALEQAALIGVDWGSTGLRAFLIGPEGDVLHETATAQGASTLVGAQAFAAALEGVAGVWRRARPLLPVLACGMVGSRHGWVEAPYVACPANTGALAAGLRRSADGVWIAPGMLCEELQSISTQLPPDLMRGEETQVLGALLRHPGLAQGACLVLPGTHSKWVHVTDGHIARFATHMTGELYAVLRAHSVLGRLMNGAAADSTGPAADAADVAFTDGVDAVCRHDHLGVLHQIFAARTLGLMERLPAASLAAYLSGVLIGHEVRAGLAWRAQHGLSDLPMALVGHPGLCNRYRLALQRFTDVSFPVLDNTAPAGLLALARAAGLLPAQPSNLDPTSAT